MSMYKIFQIGFNRCGTNFIHAFLQDMKYKSIHWDGGKLACKIHENFENNRPLLEGYNGFDAFTDMENVDQNMYAHVQYYKELDRQYPNSKFILNTRNVKIWIDKRLQSKDYVEKSMKNLGIDNNDEKILIGIWFNQWMEHHNDVLNYFGKDRIGKDLLVYDIDRDNFQQLFIFLSDQRSMYDRFHEIYSHQLHRFEYPKDKLFLDDIKIYCMCLPQRKEDIIKTFSNFGIQDYVHYFDAITPTDIQDDDIALLTSIKMRSLPNSVCHICFNSHYGIYNKTTTFCLYLAYVMCFYNGLEKFKGNNYATLIFEDDIYFKCDVQQLTPIYQEFKRNNYDVLYLGFCYCKNGEKLRPEHSNELIVRLPPKQSIACLHAVMYKNDYLKKIFPSLFPQVDFNDIHMNHLNILNNAKVGILKNPVVFQDRDKFGSFNNNGNDLDNPLYSF